MRNLVLVLGDQLDRGSAAFDGFDPKLDRVWMAEVDEESQHVPSHKARIVLFLSAMRHLQVELEERGWSTDYREIDSRGNTGSLSGELLRSIRRHRPERLILVQPGDHRVLESLLGAAAKAELPVELRPDRHFLCSPEEFDRHAAGRKALRMEFFYREMRRRHGVLMDGTEPAGGQWNFDPDNRGTFGKSGPKNVPPPPVFKPDHITRQVIDLVQKRFPNHPGQIEDFNWPVTPAEADQALQSFLAERLPDFGRYQDAMWEGEPFLYHSLISTSLNLKLLSPRAVIEQAEAAYRAGRAPLAAVEGFIRQILGWREYVRGVYWRFMPEYLEGNTLEAERPLPDFYWTGDTPMNCLRQSIGQTLRHGYAHHIQRLMVTGLYALLAGIHPRHVHEWYLAVYVDAVEWVELPNTLGMSQYADGGIMASKPYVASGKYIQRMSNYCSGCRFDPSQRTGPHACPITTLYWDFLLRHEARLRGNQRMTMQLRNARNLSEEQRIAIRRQAAELLGEG
jgi:deoxyribodipyrimidine photolyase-related protein